MKYYGDVNLQSNQLQEAVLPLDTAFPASPKVGRLVFKNKILYICVEINQDNIPIWVPLTKEITNYTHIQGTAASTWTIDHNLNSTSVNVTVYDLQNRVVLPGEIEVVTKDQVVISFSGTASGRAVVLTGYVDGTTIPSFAYEFTQSTPSTTWTIIHGLGRMPIVRVFIGAQEVQPESITFDSLNQITITFLTPQVGQVKLI